MVIGTLCPLIFTMMTGNSPSNCSGTVTDSAVCERPPPPCDPAAMSQVATLSKTASSERVGLLVRICKQMAIEERNDADRSPAHVRPTMHRNAKVGSHAAPAAGTVQFSLLET